MQAELVNLCVKSVMITGSNRGVGLELVKQLTKLPTPPSHIFATCRNPNRAKELQELAALNTSVHVLQFDATNYEKLKDLVSTVQGTVGEYGLNLLVNNAGILDRSAMSSDNVTPEMMRQHFEVNSIAPFMIAREMKPLLKQAAQKFGEGQSMSCSRAAVINVSSKVGSVTENTSGGLVPYRCSKAALNSISKSLSVELKDDGVLVLMMHPGWVKTEMGGANALIDTATCAEGMLKVMAAVDEKNTGMFYDYKGQQIPW